jgi:hypothetical protein
MAARKFDSFSDYFLIDLHEPVLIPPVPMQITQQPITNNDRQQVLSHFHAQGCGYLNQANTCYRNNVIR